jgi:hypothetical protein
MARLKPCPSGWWLRWDGRVVEMGGSGRALPRAMPTIPPQRTKNVRRGPGLSDDEAVGEDGAPIPAVLRGWRVGGGANEGHFRVARWESQT